ncbi:MAG: phytanoyl-CoA dioxygenase family protein [Pseudomonadales bacterium]|nr:phytanoyl-CoA dioxygenase family protein [Pseudomonadales bacterium]
MSEQDIEILRQQVNNLTNSHRQSPDFETAVALYKSRCELAEQLTGRAETPYKIWPPANIPDLFADKKTVIPEVTASELTPELALSAIVHHSCIMVRGMFDRETALSMVDDAWSVLTPMLDGSYDSKGSYPDEIWPKFGPCRGMRKNAMNEKSLLIGDSPELTFRVLEAFGKSGLTRLVSSLFGEQPALLWSKWGFRHVPPETVKMIRDTGLSPWHQDGTFMGTEIRVINAWISLCDCGRDAPGMHILPKKVGPVKTGTGNAARHDVVGEDMVAALSADNPVYAPEFHIGDVLLFDKYLLHRTQPYNEQMVNTRYAIESWFAAPSNYHASPLHGMYPVIAC